MKRNIMGGLVVALATSIIATAAPATAASTTSDLHAQLCSAKTDRMVAAADMTVLESSVVDLGVAGSSVEEVSYSISTGERCDIALVHSTAATEGRPVFATYDYLVDGTRTIKGYQPYSVTARKGSAANMVVPTDDHFSLYGVPMPAGVVELSTAVYRPSSTGTVNGASYTDNLHALSWNASVRIASYTESVKVVPSAEAKSAAKSELRKAVKKAKKVFKKAKAKATSAKAVKAAKKTYAKSVVKAERRYASKIVTKVVDREVPSVSSGTLSGTVGPSAS